MVVKIFRSPKSGEPKTHGAELRYFFIIFGVLALATGLLKSQPFLVLTVGGLVALLVFFASVARIVSEYFVAKK